MVYIFERQRKGNKFSLEALEAVIERNLTYFNISLIIKTANWSALPLPRILTLPCFPNWHGCLQHLFRLACFFRCFRFRFHREKFDVTVPIAGGKLFAASVPAPVKGEDLVVMHVHVGDGVRGTPLSADCRGLGLLSCNHMTTWTTCFWKRIFEFETKLKTNKGISASCMCHP